MTKYNLYELLQLHFDCMYTYEDGKMAYENEPWGSMTEAPLLAVGQTVDGELVYRFGRRANADFIDTALPYLTCCDFDIANLCRILQCGAEQELCFYRSDETVRTGDNNCRMLTCADVELLEATFKGFGEELSVAQPYFGCFCDGKVVSICRSVRIGRGHEAGIETLHEYRRRGFAYELLGLWENEVRRQGSIPLYSADIANAASIGLARKAGFKQYAHGYSLFPN